MPKQQGKYLYCVIKEEQPKEFNISGQNGKEVHTVNAGDLALVVSDTSQRDFSFIKQHLTSHQQVIEQIMDNGYDVLPVRFNTVADSEQDLKQKVLKAKREKLLEAFPIVEGRVELGLRAFWKDMPSVFEEVTAENPKIQKAKKKAQQSSSRMKIAGVGELVQKAVDAKRENEASRIVTPLKELAADFKERELKRQKEVTKDSMILSYAFLVDKEKEQQFDKKVEALTEENKERIKFKYLGPIPPFNFVELSLKV